jgi:hypothetical protein
MIYRRFFFILTFLILSLVTFAQKERPFPEKCEGKWAGNMIIYSQDKAMDTIDVSMVIEALQDTLGWTWRTVYTAPERTITKDYKLYPLGGNKYDLDEGDDLHLFSYVFENRMYSNFMVQGSLLTSVYTLNGDELIFEITSGRDIGKTANDITNFSVMNLQRSFLRRVKE